MKNSNIIDGIDNHLPELDVLKNKVKQAFTVMSISYKEKEIFYKRENSNYSQLGIQVGPNREDLDDYIVLVKEEESISMHISGSISSDGNMIINLISEDICSFFDNVEHNFSDGFEEFKMDIHEEISPSVKRKSIIETIRAHFK